MAKYTCRYCLGATKNKSGTCSNCKEKVDIITRIQAMLR